MKFHCVENFNNDTFNHRLNDSKLTRVAFKKPSKNAKENGFRFFKRGIKEKKEGLPYNPYF